MQTNARTRAHHCCCCCCSLFVCLFEGINQNPAYYEYTFDTAWHTTPQPLDAWFQSYAARRYGNIASTDTAAAWKLLSTTVYSSQAGGWHDNTGVEWNAVTPSPGSTGMTADTLMNVYEAWLLLTNAAGGGGGGGGNTSTKANTIDVEEYDTFNYDLVNVGREVLAQLITVMEANMTAAVAAGKRVEALAFGGAVMQAYTDLDTLLGCDYGFLLGTAALPPVASHLIRLLFFPRSISFSSFLSFFLSFFRKSSRGGHSTGGCSTSGSGSKRDGSQRSEEDDDCILFMAYLLLQTSLKTATDQ